MAVTKKGKKEAAEAVASTSTKNTALHIKAGLTVSGARVNRVYHNHGVNKHTSFCENALKYAFCEHTVVTKTRKVLKPVEESPKAAKGKKTKKTKKGKEEAAPAASTAPVKVEENYTQIELGAPDLKKTIPLSKIGASFTEYIEAINKDGLAQRNTNPLPGLSGLDHKKWLADAISTFDTDSAAAQKHIKERGTGTLEGKYKIEHAKHTYKYYMHIVKYFKFHFEKRAGIAFTAYVEHLFKEMIRHIQINKKLELEANTNSEKESEVKTCYCKIADLLERIEGEARLFDVLRKSSTFMKLYMKYHDIQTRIKQNDALEAALANRTINKPETEGATKASKPQKISSKILGTPELTKSLDITFKDLDARWQVHNFCAYINKLIQDEHREQGGAYKITVRTDLRDFMSHVMCEIIQAFSDAAASLVKYANQRTIKQHAIMHAAEIIGTSPNTTQEMLAAVARHDEEKAAAAKKPKVPKKAAAKVEEESDDDSDESGDE